MAADAGDRFELIEQLGRGGMGVVWKARDRETGEVVALKMIRTDLADDAEYVARFEREVELARRVSSPNVVHVLGYGRAEGVPYLSMEYVPGPTLRERITASGAMVWEEVWGIAFQLARALAAVHAAGIIHRDVKPSNVMLAPGGIVKLGDFGIAKSGDLTQLTRVATFVGTAAYMAPDGEASPRSDLYSLGCVLYEALAGVVPFPGESQNEVLMKHIQRPPDLERVPVAARPLLAWLLAKDPTSRPADGGALLAALSVVPPAIPAVGAAVRVAVPPVPPAPTPPAPSPATASGAAPARRSATRQLGIVVVTTAALMAPALQFAQDLIIPHMHSMLELLHATSFATVIVLLELIPASVITGIWSATYVMFLRSVADVRGVWLIPAAGMLPGAAFGSVGLVYFYWDVNPPVWAVPAALSLVGFEAFALLVTFCLPVGTRKAWLAVVGLGTFGGIVGGSLVGSWVGAQIDPQASVYIWSKYWYLQFIAAVGTACVIYAVALVYSTYVFERRCQSVRVRAGRDTGLHRQAFEPAPNTND